MVPSVCRHCKVRAATRPRGLCYTCHNDRAVREQYPISEQAQKFRGHGVPDFEGEGAEPSGQLPTDHDQRVAELASRAAAGQRLFPKRELCPTY